GLFNLEGLAPVLTLNARIDLEYQYDYLFFEVSPDGGNNWQRLRNWNRPTDTWWSYAVPLNEYAGQAVKVRFRMASDYSDSFDGVWLDDIRIGGEKLTALHPSVGSISLSPSSVVGGKTSTGKVVLSAPAPAPGTLVEIST